jgi:hypothetical protein
MTATRRSRPGPACPPIPRPLTPFVLQDAPELAAIALLEHALDVVRLALLARHAHLLDPDAPPWVEKAPEPGEAIAGAFFKRAYHLGLLLRRYRGEVAGPCARQDAAGTNEHNDV